jgi:hypothetical protein
VDEHRDKRDYHVLEDGAKGHPDTWIDSCPIDAWKQLVVIEEGLAYISLFL